MSLSLCCYLPLPLLPGLVAHCCVDLVNVTVVPVAISAFPLLETYD